MTDIRRTYHPVTERKLRRHGAGEPRRSRDARLLAHLREAVAALLNSADALLARGVHVDMLCALVRDRARRGTTGAQSAPGTRMSSGDSSTKANRKSHEVLRGREPR